MAGRLARHRAGIKMSLSQTTPEFLAEKILRHSGTEPETIPIPTDGVRRAAQMIEELL